MTKLTKISRLAKLTVALVASAALMSSMEIANAKGGDHHQNHNAQSTAPRPHFVISGQPANVKRVTRATKKKEMADKKKGCGKIIVPTAECGVSSKNPVGSTIPTLPSQAGGSNPTPKGPSPAYTTVTLSNGVTTSAIFNGKGLTVTSTSPGTITVSNGTNSVTMPGGIDESFRRHIGSGRCRCSTRAPSEWRRNGGGEPDCGEWPRKTNRHEQWPSGSHGH